MTEKMSEAEVSLWRQIQADYSHALAIALKVWGDNEQIPEPAVLQAAAATCMIAIQKLREGPHRASQPSTPSAALTSGGQETVNLRQPSTAPIGVPPCPKCGGEMWDNRENKKNPKGVDFSCKQKKGPCVNEKGFKTGLWLKDLKPSPVMQQAMATTRTLAEVPVGLDGDAREDDLPF